MQKLIITKYITEKKNSILGTYYMIGHANF